MDTFSKAPENQLQINQSLQSSAEKQSERPTEKVKKVFSRGSWVFLFTFLPITVLILLSQNTIPGDLFYPVKRSMENVVLAGASVSPATRVAFRTDLTERRFSEAETLLLARQDTTGLETFIEEVTKTEQEIATLSNEDAKKDVTEKLIEKIDEYQNKLVAIEEQAQSVSIALPLPTLTPVPVKTDSQESETVLQEEPTTTIASPTPTSTEQKPSVTPAGSFKEPSPTQSTLEPTPSDVLLDYPTPTPVPIPIEEENEIVKAINDTQKKLDEIKKKLEENSGERSEKEEDNAKGKSYEVRQNENNDKDADEDEDDEED